VLDPGPSPPPGWRLRSIGPMSAASTCRAATALDGPRDATHRADGTPASSAGPLLDACASAGPLLISMRQPASGPAAQPGVKAAAGARGRRSRRAR